MHPNTRTVVINVKTEKDLVLIEDLQDYMEVEQENLAKELGVSSKAAGLIQYLRSRSRWTQEKEDHLIFLDKQWKKLPNVLCGEF